MVYAVRTAAHLQQTLDASKNLAPEFFLVMPGIPSTLHSALFPCLVFVEQSRRTEHVEEHKSKAAPMMM